MAKVGYGRSRGDGQAAMSVGVMSPGVELLKLVSCNRRLWRDKKSSQSHGSG